MTKQLEDYPNLYRKINRLSDEVQTYWGSCSGLGGMVEVVQTSEISKVVLELAQQLESQQKEIEQLKARVQELKSMLDHLVKHDCISDCSLHKECETLLNKESK